MRLQQQMPQTRFSRRLTAVVTENSVWRNFLPTHADIMVQCNLDTSDGYGGMVCSVRIEQII
jgi:hypothetical protein